ncbi:hypothetical protein [Streptobacillus moniliformis]|uniref:hypothetical protein n=1 Tax=Streptobacillus moniliformis TaxID=34105 RepID=UPI0007E3E6A4|nr:hypothetical protein [Streptobacillus moniliformis]
MKISTSTKKLIIKILKKIIIETLKTILILFLISATCIIFFPLGILLLGIFNMSFSGKIFVITVILWLYIVVYNYINYIIYSFYDIFYNE